MSLLNNERNQQSMNLRIQICVVNVIPVANPMPMNKSDKYKVEIPEWNFNPKSICIRNRKLAPYFAYSGLVTTSPGPHCLAADARPRSPQMWRMWLAADGANLITGSTGSTKYSTKKGGPLQGE